MWIVPLIRCTCQTGSSPSSLPSLVQSSGSCSDSCSTGAAVKGIVRHFILFWFATSYYRPANEVWGKVKFSQTSVILFTGGRACPGGVHTRGGAMYARGHAWLGGMHGRACMAGETATAADGTHPTGMHSCLWSFHSVLVCIRLFMVIWLGTCLTDKILMTCPTNDSFTLMETDSFTPSLSMIVVAIILINLFKFSYWSAQWFPVKLANQH